MNRFWISCALSGLLAIGGAMLGCEEQRPVTPPPPDETEPPPPPPDDGAAMEGRMIYPARG
jgi:hypothetical protein